MQAVLADTGPLYAATDRDDRYHEQAHRELARLEAEKSLAVILYSTLLEAYTLIMRHLGLRAAHTWLDDIRHGAVLLNPSIDDYTVAMALTRSYADQPLTLCDAVLAVVSGRLGYPVWTYDHHFDLMHAAVWR